MKQYLTPLQLKAQRTINIGIDVISHKPFKVYDYYLGDVYGIFGMTGYGKSILAGNIAVELSKHRPLLILDYKGDYKNLKFPNWMSRHGIHDSIPDLVYIHRFGFKLQDFTNPFDWEMLGMTRNGANLCSSKAKKVEEHKNNFNIFREMVEDTETFSKFSKSSEVWQSTKQSVLSKLNIVRGAFIDDKNSIDITHADLNAVRYTKYPFYVSNWAEFIRKHRHVCLNLNSEFQPAKAQLFAGKILNDIEPALENVHPVILVEEAHKLCPEFSDENNVPYSLIKILHYLKELHKKGVKVVLISQYPHQLQNEALDEIKRFFVGKLQNIKGYSKLDEIFKLSLDLNYNHIAEYREFWHYSPLYNEKNIFVPYDSFTYYEKRH